MLFSYSDIEPYITNRKYTVAARVNQISILPVLPIKKKKKKAENEKWKRKLFFLSGGINSKTERI